MNNPLIDDFINKTNPEPEIPKEDNEEPVVITYIPTMYEYAGEDVDFTKCLPVGIPVGWVGELSKEEREEKFVALKQDLKVVCKMFSDIAKYGEEAIPHVYDNIKPHAEAMGINVEHSTDNMIINTCVILSDVYAYLTELLRYIALCYNIPYNYGDGNGTEVVSDDTEEIDSFITEEQSEHEDEHFADMLAAELIGATDGEDFTNEELYGNEVNDNE